MNDAAGVTARLSYAEARLTDRDGRLICHGTGSCLIVAR